MSFSSFYCLFSKNCFRITFQAQLFSNSLIFDENNPSSIFPKASIPVSIPGPQSLQEQCYGQSCVETATILELLKEHRMNELTWQQHQKHQLQLQSTLPPKFSCWKFEKFDKFWNSKMLKLARFNLLWNDLNEMRIYINLLMSEKINFTS